VTREGLEENARAGDTIKFVGAANQRASRRSSPGRHGAITASLCSQPKFAEYHNNDKRPDHQRFRLAASESKRNDPGSGGAAIEQWVPVCCANAGGLSSATTANGCLAVSDVFVRTHQIRSNDR